MESFSDKWFTIYYVVLGILTLTGGFYFLIKTSHFIRYLEHHTETGPPPAVRNVLKYFLLFTIPSLILSFTPFSWIELLFSIWSLFMVFIIGLQLVRWKQAGKAFLHHPDRLKNYTRIAGAIMVAVGLVMFMLGYLTLSSLSR